MDSQGEYFFNFPVFYNLVFQGQPNFPQYEILTAILYSDDLKWPSASSSASQELYLDSYHDPGYLSKLSHGATSLPKRNRQAILDTNDSALATILSKYIKDGEGKRDLLLYLINSNAIRVKEAKGRSEIIAALSSGDTDDMIMARLLKYSLKYGEKSAPLRKEDIEYLVSLMPPSNKTPSDKTPPDTTPPDTAPPDTAPPTITIPTTALPDATPHFVTSISAVVDFEKLEYALIYALLVHDAGQKRESIIEGLDERIKAYAIANSIAPLSEADDDEFDHVSAQYSFFA